LSGLGRAGVPRRTRCSQITDDAWSRSAWQPSPSGAEAPFQARTLVARWLDGHGDAQYRDDVRLLVTELVTNSVRHAGQPAGAPVRVTTAAADGLVRVEDEDHGHFPVRRRGPGLAGGHGLDLVKRLGARWGVE
jgi:anti-sigma regulatory factor (Ser/Thr protein kinase)